MVEVVELTVTPRGPSPTVARLVGLVLDLLALLATALGALAVVAGPVRGGLLILIAVAIGALQLLRSRVAAREAEQRWDPLGRVAVGVRASVVVGVAAAFALTAGGTSQASAAALAAFVGLGCLGLEPLLGRVGRYSVPVAAHLPGIAEPKPEPDLGAAVILTGLSTAAVGVVQLALGASAWWWLVVELVAVVPALAMLGLTARRVVAGRRQRTMLPGALAGYAPDFLLFTGRPDDASYQLVMWLEYFRRTGLRFALVTRAHLPAVALAEAVPEPVVEARSAAELRRLAPDSVRAAFYVNASGHNGSLVADRRLRHIYIGHGDSDKPPSFNPTHALYDEIFTAGPAAARRYPAHGVSIAPDKFRVVGRPQVEDVAPARGPIGARLAERTDQPERTRPVVLYAPTWRGHIAESALSSLAVGERIVSALLARDVTVVFRSHPLSRAIPEDAAVVGRIGALLAADVARTGRPHRWGAAAETEVGILECLNDSDAMVTDVSSVVSDYLFSTKPFAMIAVPAEPATFVEDYPVARASYVIRGDLADLETQLDEMLGTDPLADRRAAVRADYLGDFDTANYADGFVDAVREVCRLGPVLPPVATEPARSAEPVPSGDDAGPLGKRRAVVVSAGQLAGTLMAAAAVAIALLGGPGWLVALVVLAGTAELFWASTAALRHPGQWLRLLDGAPAARVALVVAGPLVAITAGHRSGVWLLAAVLALAALVAEDPIRQGWLGGLLARRLPGLTQPIRPGPSRGLVPVLGLGFGVASGVLAAAPGAGRSAAAGWLVLAGAAVLAAVTGLVVERALRRAEQVDDETETLQRALRAHGAEFVVYSPTAVGSLEIYRRWLPVLDAVGRPWLIAARSRAVFDEIDRVCRSTAVDVPIVLRPYQRGVEDVIVPPLGTALYLDDSPGNTHLVERRDLTHVRLNLLAAGCHPEHAIYDLVFVPERLDLDSYRAAGIQLPAGKLRTVPDAMDGGASPAETAGFLDVLGDLVDSRRTSV